MTERTIRRYNDGEVLSGVQRRRRWTPEEKVRIVAVDAEPACSEAAREHHRRCRHQAACAIRTLHPEIDGSRLLLTSTGECRVTLEAGRAKTVIFP